MDHDSLSSVLLAAALPRSCTFCLVLGRIGYAMVANQCWNLCGTAKKTPKNTYLLLPYRLMETGRDSPSSMAQPSCEDAITLCDFQVCCYRGGEACKLTPAFKRIIPEIICVSTAPNPLGKISNIIEGWRAGSCLECMDIWWVLFPPPFLYQATEAKLRSSQWMRTGNEKDYWDQRIWSNQ